MSINEQLHSVKLRLVSVVAVYYGLVIVLGAMALNPFNIWGGIWPDVSGALQGGVITAAIVGLGVIGLAYLNYWITKDSLFRATTPEEQK
jgi:hypothetical protein